MAMFWGTLGLLGPGYAQDGEAELVAILQSDGPKADKAIACKKLAVYGTADSVPVLASFLADPELTSWARTALEVIPGDEAAEALREAVGRTEGRTQIGIVNSIGVRRDAAAIGLLTELLKGADDEVVDAAAVAMGRIGTTESATILRREFTNAQTTKQVAMAQGCVIAAETLRNQNLPADAAKLYDAVRAADVPEIRKIEAIRGAALARGGRDGAEDAVKILQELLRSEDRKLRNIGLTLIRELPGSGVTEATVAELVHVNPHWQGLIILALADRGDETAIPAIEAAATSVDRELRLAAIEAMATMGSTTFISPLLTASADADEEVAMAALRALTLMAGDGVDAELVSLLEKTDGDARVAMLRLVGTRRIVAAVPELLKSVDAADVAVRQAAITALGETVPQDQLHVLIEQLTNPMFAGGMDYRQREVIQRALRTAAVRMPDAQACATLLTDALAGQPAEVQCELLEILAAVGSPKSLETVGDFAANGSRELQDQATKLLGNWMTPDAGPVLLGIAKNEQNGFRTRALRGYLRIARQFVMTPEERVAMCRNAMDATTRDDERKLVLEIAARYPDAKMFAIVAEAAKKYPSLEETARTVAASMVQRIQVTDDMRGLLDEMGLKAMQIEIVKARYGAEEKWVDVTEILRKYTGSLPVIALPTTGYNAAFGGDPVGGVYKHLEIEYRIDGKPGTVTFDENAIIALPIPE